MKTETARLLYDVRVFFQAAFGNEPSQELLDIISSEIFEEAVSILAPEGGLDAAYARVLEKAGMYDVEKMRDEYTRLFIGPVKLPAPPWESVYKSGEPVLFDKHMLKVRETYQAHGFATAQEGIADDHLAIELDFMALLSEDAAAACEEGSKGRLMLRLESSGSFLEKHLNQWVPLFAAELESAGESIYLSLARLLQEYLKLDAARLAEIAK